MGLTPELLLELDLPQFEDAITARRYIEEQAWPEGPVCPHCGSVDRAYRLNGPRSRYGLYHCAVPTCRKHFTVTVKTSFENTRVPLHQWLIVTAALSKTPATMREISCAIGVTGKTAWRMRSIIRPDLLRKNKGNLDRQFLYPFLTSYRQTPEHEMLRNISAAVPLDIPHDRRADICQELAVAILVGDIEARDLRTKWRTKFHEVYKLHPTIWGPLSLDAPIGGSGPDDPFTLLDVLSDEESAWDFA